MAVDKKTKRGLEAFKAQSKKYIEALPKTEKKKKKEEARLRRLLRLMKMAALGRHYKVPRKLETVRTKAVTRGIREAGLTEAEIRRLKGR